MTATSTDGDHFECHDLATANPGGVAREFDAFGNFTLNVETSNIDAITLRDASVGISYPVIDLQNEYPSTTKMVTAEFSGDGEEIIIKVYTPDSVEPFYLESTEIVYTFIVSEIIGSSAPLNIRKPSKNLANLRIRIVPNPATKEFKVKIINGVFPMYISILDISGRELIRTKIDSEEHLISTAKLAEGVYILDVVDATGRLIGYRKITIIP